MFGPPGHAYVYFTYGMYFCFNAVTGAEGTGDAVLIRAVEPLVGWELMSARRGLPEDEIDRLVVASSESKVRERWGRALTAGPGKLCQAFDLTRAQDGFDLANPGGLWIEPSRSGFGVPDPAAICTSPRIGIRHSADRPWRFTLRDDPYVSRK